MTKSATSVVRVVAPGQTYTGKQGFTYGSGASAETVGARQICMNVLPMPAGARAKAHDHESIETIAYLVDGECAVYDGDQLGFRVMSSCRNSTTSRLRDRWRSRRSVW